MNRKHELVSALIGQNSSLARENRRLNDLIAMVERVLRGIESEASDTGLVPIHGISPIRESLREVVVANEDRLLRETGRRAPPSDNELLSLAEVEGKIQAYFTVIDPKDIDGILNHIMQDIIDTKATPKHPRKRKDPKPPDEDAGHHPPKKHNWGINYGGDLEGEWEDEEDFEDPH